MSHIHELQFVEKGGVQCSTLGCHVYYSEEHIIKILERLANENTSQHSVQADGATPWACKCDWVNDANNNIQCVVCGTHHR